MGRWRDHALEEGSVLTPRTVAIALLDYVREYGAVRTYMVAWSWLVVLLLLRPAATPPMRVLTNPTELADLYGTMRSADVVGDTDVSAVTHDMFRAMHAFNQTICFAAIHMGVPLRIGIVGAAPGADESIVLINPRVVPETGLDRLSTAKESSAFWPHRRPVSMQRAFPVMLRCRDGYHLFDDRVQAHCVHHLLDAFDGVHIYDRRPTAA